MKSEIKSLPMVALRGMTIMPEMVVHFDISRERSIAAVQEAMVEDQKIFLVLQREQDAENPGQKEMYEVGTVASVRQIIKLPKKILRVLVAGEARGILKSIEYETPYLRAEVEILDESDFQSPEDLNGQAMIRGLKDIFVDYAAKNGKMSKEGVGRILEISDLKELVDEISANIPLYYTDQQEILNQTDFWKRYEMLAFKLVNEVQIMDIKDDIRAKVKERVDKHQREYILREQLKLIREELGDDTTLSDAEEFEQAAKKLIFLFGMLPDISLRLLVYREDPVLGSCLNGHIGHSKAVVHRQAGNAVPGKLHGLVQRAVHTDLSYNMDDNVLAADIRSRLPGQYKLDSRGYLEPQLPCRHPGCDVGCPNAGGECPQRPVCTGMGICSDDALSCGDNSRLGQNGMLDSGLALLKEPA